jgi:hypothetical protein
VVLLIIEYAMNPIKAFIYWLLKHPCATPGCNTLISRWVGADEVVIVGNEKRLYEQNGILCPICLQQKLHEMPLEQARQLTVILPTGRTWIGGDLDF